MYTDMNFRCVVILLSGSRTFKAIYEVLAPKLIRFHSLLSQGDFDLYMHFRLFQNFKTVTLHIMDRLRSSIFHLIRAALFSDYISLLMNMT